MQPDRWRRIDEIFHSALRIDEGRRTAFLDETCSGDEDLRMELHRLLAKDKEADSFMASPALDMAAAELVPKAPGETVSSVDQRAGEIISHYQILARIGCGGMGVVYKAEDIRLGRLVALKFLTEDLGSDRDAMQRFEREARAASSLNHRNICTIYGVEEHNGQPVIVMELLEGVSLRERIREGPLGAHELLEFGVQICDALEAAHSRGIIHRDIKPANIFVTHDRRLKILDFGLAKVLPVDGEARQSTEESLTLQGVIAGTTSYMSPEQARGEPIDARSDLFSLGVVLYELSTGQSPFARKSTVMTIDAILNVCPPVPTSLNATLPAGLDALIARLLEKDREQRYPEAAAVASQLKRLRLHPIGSMASRRVRTWSRTAVALVVTLAVAGGAYFYFHRKPVLTGRDTIVLADFRNTTGDAVFDGTLRQGLAVQLEQSPFLSVVPEGYIQKTLRLMGQPADARLTPDLAREICERTASAAVLEGSIMALGTQYVLALRARNCRTGDILDEQQVQAARKEDVLNALSRIATKFRNRAGESLSSVEQHSMPLAEAATSSLEALKSYSMGWKVLNSAGAPAALPFFKRATELDPNFAAGFAWLGWRYGEVGDLGLGRASILKAWQLRARASDQERFFINFSYDRIVTGNLEEAHRTCELWAQTYPRDLHPHSFLGATSKALGKYDKAEEETRKTIELNPDHAFAYANLAASYLFRNRLEEATNTLQNASARKLDMPDLVCLRYAIAFLKNDHGEMERLVALGQKGSSGDDWTWGKEAAALAYSGRLQKARENSQRAVALANEGGHHEKAAQYEAATAVREVLFGNISEARQSAMATLNLSNDKDAAYGAALALGFAGDSSQSQTVMEDLQKRFAEDTIVRFSYLPALRALLALNRHEPLQAIEQLQAAARYELGYLGSTSVGFVGSLYPIYARGSAYLATHEGAKAAAEFQKILDHRGIVGSDPIGALARLQLGRAFALAGNKARARSAYQDFLALWKDADPGIPILIQANLEYARL
jgi:serine/threonine protein kinase/tetratricopeptide (TPR) repeat protein